MTERSLYLHIGVPKSGTTYLQSVLASNRKELRRGGMLFPVSSHFHAAQDVLGRQFRGHDDPLNHGAWASLVKQVHRFKGDAVVSAEMLCRAREDDVRRIVGSFPDHRVHVTLTARDLARQIPAAWQENVKNGGTLPLPDFVRRVHDLVEGGLDRSKGFWSHQALPEVLSWWRAVLDPDRITVVTVPPSGADPDLLWRRFCQAIGIDPDLAKDVEGAPNASLGVVETEFLRRINVGTDFDGNWPLYRSRYKRFLVPRYLSGRPGRTGIRLPVSADDWVTSLAQSMVDRLAGEGYPVVGDLAELLPKPTSPQTPQIADADVAELGVQLVAELTAAVQTGLVPDDPGEGPREEQLEGTESPGSRGPAPDDRSGSVTTVFLVAGVLAMDAAALRDAWQRNRDVLRARGYRLWTPASGRDGIVGRGQVERWVADEAVRTVVVATSDLLDLPEAQMQGMLDSLKPADVQVVLCVHPTTDIVAAQWVESVARGSSQPFAEYLEGWTSSIDGTDAVSDAVLRWVALVGAPRVRVVTMAELATGPFPWRRLWEAVEVDPVDLVASDARPAGLGALTAELRRLVNVRTPGLGAPGGPRERFEQPLLTLVGSARVKACDRSDKMAAAIGRSGARVLGDLVELVPRPTLSPGEDEVADPCTISPSVLLRAAVADLVDLAVGSPAVLARASVAPTDRDES